MKLFRFLTGHLDSVIKRAIFFHRYYRIAKEKKKYLLSFVLACFANYYSRKYNLELYGKYGDNLQISHLNIVINGNAVIGNNVIFHGNNCVGNNSFMGKSPRIGNNVEVGYGAIVIGDIEIADNVVIGAGCLVNKSILLPGAIVVGNPARIIERN